MGRIEICIAKKPPSNRHHHLSLACLNVQSLAPTTPPPHRPSAFVFSLLTVSVCLSFSSQQQKTLKKIKNRGKKSPCRSRGCTQGLRQYYLFINLFIYSLLVLLKDCIKCVSKSLMKMHGPHYLCKILLFCGFSG